MAKKNLTHVHWKNSGPTKTRPSNCSLYGVVAENDRDAMGRSSSYILFWDDITIIKKCFTSHELFTFGQTLIKILHTPFRVIFSFYRDRFEFSKAPLTKIFCLYTIRTEMHPQETYTTYLQRRHEAYCSSQSRRSEHINQKLARSDFSMQMQGRKSYSKRIKSIHQHEDGHDSGMRRFRHIQRGNSISQKE